MPVDQNLVFALDEIRGFRVLCSKCSAIVSFPLDLELHLPEKCPGCKATWKADPVGGPQEDFEAFIRALKIVRSTDAYTSAPPFRVQIEFPAPTE